MSYQTLTLRINGVAPVIMNSGDMADPFNPHVQAKSAVSTKRKKTLEDHLELQRLEFRGCMYYDEELGPILPQRMLIGTLIAGAKKSRNGEKAKAGLLVEGDTPLLYDGPRKLEELWEDGRFRFTTGVGQQGKRVSRTRPRFNPPWSVEFPVSFLPDVVDERTVYQFAMDAGRFCGFGDWRPQHGRFTVETV